MSAIPNKARLALISCIPAYIINEITCFVFYDHHPRDKKVIDVTVCTMSGHVKEFYQREVVRTEVLGKGHRSRAWTQIKIIRNLKCELFYLVSSEDSVIILSSADSLQIFKTFYDIESFDVDAHPRSGAPILNIYVGGNYAKIDFCDNSQSPYKSKSLEALEDYPLVNNLKRQLSEIKYNIKCNEKCYEEFVRFRQIAAFCAYQEMRPNIENTVFTDEYERVTTAILIETLDPWTKIWNQKVVIVVNITNKNDVPIEELQLLLHDSSKQSLVYKTKLFQSTTELPYWVEMSNHCLEPLKQTSLVVVLDCKELECSLVGNIEFRGVLFYKKQEKECFHPLNKVVLTINEIMAGSYDLLFNHQLDDPKIQLAILACSERTDLLLRHIKGSMEEELVMQDMFCNYLNMEKIAGCNVGLLHKNNPLHKLHGVMVVFEESESPNGKYSISVYTRSSSEVIALIHCINEFIPARIVATLHTQRLKSHTSEFAQYNEDTTPPTAVENYQDYATSILNQTTIILEYLDHCMNKQKKQNDTNVKKIDLFADGNESFLKFKIKLMGEASKGFHNFVKRNTHK